MPAIAAIRASRRAIQTLRRTAGLNGPRVVSCRSEAALDRVLEDRVVDALVVAARRESLPDLDRFRARFPVIPVLAYAPFRPDDGPLLAEC